jgi:shikimate kinase
VGLRCSGKTSVGRRLAAELGRAFVDLDDETLTRGRAEGREADSAGDLLARIGEPDFRRLEADALDAILDCEESCVLATGGGIVETPACRERLACEAVTIWLSEDVELLGRRLRADSASRPSLTGADPAEELATLLKRRGPWYREVSTWKVDCGARSIEELTREIRALLAIPDAS